MISVTVDASTSHYYDILSIIKVSIEERIRDTYKSSLLYFIPRFPKVRDQMFSGLGSTWSLEEAQLASVTKGFSIETLYVFNRSNNRRNSILTTDNGDFYVPVAVQKRELMRDAIGPSCRLKASPVHIHRGVLVVQKRCVYPGTCLPKTAETSRVLCSVHRNNLRKITTDYTTHWKV